MQFFFISLLVLTVLANREKQVIVLYDPCDTSELTGALTLAPAVNDALTHYYNQSMSETIKQYFAREIRSIFIRDAFDQALSSLGIQVEEEEDISYCFIGQDCKPIHSDTILPSHCDHRSEQSVELGQLPEFIQSAQSLLHAKLDQTKLTILITNLSPTYLNGTQNLLFDVEVPPYTSAYQQWEQALGTHTYLNKLKLFSFDRLRTWIDKYRKRVAKDPDFALKTQAQVLAESTKSWEYKSWHFFLDVWSTSALFETHKCFFNSIVREKFKYIPDHADVTITYTWDDEIFTTRGKGVAAFDEPAAHVGCPNPDVMAIKETEQIFDLWSLMAEAALTADQETVFVLDTPNHAPSFDEIDTDRLRLVIREYWDRWLHFVVRVPEDLVSEWRDFFHQMDLPFHAIVHPLELTAASQVKSLERQTALEMVWRPGGRGVMQMAPFREITKNCPLQENGLMIEYYPWLNRLQPWMRAHLVNAIMQSDARFLTSLSRSCVRQATSEKFMWFDWVREFDSEADLEWISLKRPAYTWSEEEEFQIADSLLTYGMHEWDHGCFSASSPILTVPEGYRAWVPLTIPSWATAAMEPRYADFWRYAVSAWTQGRYAMDAIYHAVLGGDDDSYGEMTASQSRSFVSKGPLRHFEYRQDYRTGRQLNWHYARVLWTICMDEIDEGSQWRQPGSHIHLVSLHGGDGGTATDTRSGATDTESVRSDTIPAPYKIRSCIRHGLGSDYDMYMDNSLTYSISRMNLTTGEIKKSNNRVWADVDWSQWTLIPCSHPTDEEIALEHDGDEDWFFRESSVFVSPSSDTADPLIEHILFAALDEHNSPPGTKMIAIAETEKPPESFDIAQAALLRHTLYRREVDLLVFVPFTPGWSAWRSYFFAMDLDASIIVTPTNPSGSKVWRRASGNMRIHFNNKLPRPPTQPSLTETGPCAISGPAADVAMVVDLDARPGQLRYARWAAQTLRHKYKDRFNFVFLVAEKGECKSVTEIDWEPLFADHKLHEYMVTLKNLKEDDHQYRDFDEEADLAAMMGDQIPATPGPMSKCLSTICNLKWRNEYRAAVLIDSEGPDTTYTLPDCVKENQIYTSVLSSILTKADQHSGMAVQQTWKDYLHDHELTHFALIATSGDRLAQGLDDTLQNVCIWTHANDPSTTTTQEFLGTSTTLPEQIQTPVARSTTPEVIEPTAIQTTTSSTTTTTTSASSSTSSMTTVEQLSEITVTITPWSAMSRSVISTPTQSDHGVDSTESVQNRKCRSNSSCSQCAAEEGCSWCLMPSYKFECTAHRSCATLWRLETCAANPLVSSTVFAAAAAVSFLN